MKYNQHNLYTFVPTK